MPQAWKTVSKEASLVISHGALLFVRVFSQSGFFEGHLDVGKLGLYNYIL